MAGTAVNARRSPRVRVVLPAKGDTRNVDRLSMWGAKLASCLQIADLSVGAPSFCTSRGAWARCVLGGLVVLEACCFVGAAGGVAGAVRVSAGARERAAIDDQVFLADRTAVKPALQDLAHSGRVAGLRGQ